MDPRINICDAIGILDRLDHLPERPGAPDPRRNEILNEAPPVGPDVRNNNLWRAPQVRPRQPRIPYKLITGVNEVSDIPVSRRIRSWCILALQKKLNDNYPQGEEQPNPRPYPIVHEHGQIEAGFINEYDDRAGQMLREIEGNVDQEMTQDQQQLEVVRHLINYVGIDVNYLSVADGCNCLFHAIQHHKYELARLLLDAGTETESSDLSRIQRRDRRLIRSYPNRANTPVTREFQSLNPLYFSMQLGDRKMAQILIEKGADISQVEFKTAVEMDHLDVVRLSLELGLDVNTLVTHDFHKKQCTILHLAAMLNKPDMLIYLLLEWNANVNVCDKNGLTPLSFAVKCGHRECIEILLSHHNNLPAHQDSSLLALAIQKREELTRRPSLLFNRLRSGSQNSSEKIFGDIIDLLVRHVAVLQSQGPFVDPDTYVQIEKSFHAKDYMNICKSELERMKESPVDDTTTFYDVLVKKDLGLFLRDESVIEILESCSLDRSFPIYGKLIRDRFEIKRKKIEFENRIITGLSKIFRLDLSGHHLIHHHILQHLRLLDLHTLSNI